MGAPWSARSPQRARHAHELGLSSRSSRSCRWRASGSRRSSGDGSHKQAHWIPVLAVFAAWVIAMLVCYSALTGAEPFGEHGYGHTLFTWIPAGDFVVDVGFFVDNLTACLLIVVTTIGLLVHVYSIGYMSHDPGYWRFFAYLNLFMFSMLLLVLAEQLPGRVRGLGAGRPVELPAHRVLVPQAIRRPGRQEGVHRQPRRRRRLRARDHAHLRDARHAGHPDGAARDRRGRAGRRRGHRPADLRRRDGQERPVPAARLAAGRDGGPDPGLRPHPRRHDGQRRRLPRPALQPDLRQRPGRHGRRRRDRHLHRHPGRVHRDDPDGHQARPGVLHAEPARLHVRGLRRRAPGPRRSSTS